MLATNNEKDIIELYKRVENSPYEFEDKCVFFKGRPASPVEKKTYRVQTGVNSNQDSTYLLASNCPEIKPKDKIKFRGKFWTVESIGYYYDNSRIINSGAFNEDYLAKRCPKGITIV